jgi:hypothetical protein
MCERRLFYIYLNLCENLYMQDLYHLVVMSTQNGKDADTQTVKPNKGSETDNEKEKEKEELEARCGINRWR